MIKISLWLWLSLMRELRRRGQNRRESGAFLLGKKGSQRVKKFLCYDDLDPTCLDSGIVKFNGSGQIQLSDYCRDTGLKVLADIHTHPDAWTGQSHADRTNPMISRKGHIAIIVPFYAQKPHKLFQGVGFYEYLGDYKWNNVKKIKLTWL